jgi:hypothetical protein
METIVVTRHPALVEYLVEIGLIAAGTPVLGHATAADVAGKCVIGVLPHHLSSKAACVVEVPLDLPAELRGVELSLAQVRQFAGLPVTYVVRETET